MDWTATMTWWSEWRERQQRSNVGSDCADMGTAFGLDASFDALAQPSVNEPPPALTHWESRLVRRSGL